jgi:D-alanyl-D-alanine dipeptidase
LQRFCSTLSDRRGVESLPSESRLAQIPIRDSGEALVDVRVSAPLRVSGPILLRHGLVDRLVIAQSLLPRDTRLLLVAGHLTCLAEHTTGGGVDLTLSDEDSEEPLPACCAGSIPLPQKRTSKLLISALAAAGLVNHPARWWHWSYGDRFWAHTSRTPHARYGPVPG